MDGSGTKKETELERIQMAMGLDKRAKHTAIFLQKCHYCITTLGVL